MKNLTNKIHKIRNRISCSKYDSIFSLIFIIRNIFGFLRGIFAYWTGKIYVNEGSSRNLILGFDTKLIIRPGCAVILSGKKIEIEKNTFLNNPLFPKGTSIGLDPHYICLDPPRYFTTKIDLDNKSNLILEQNTMILSGCYLTANLGAEIFVGANTYISSDVIINSRNKIHIGRNVMIGQEVRIMDYDAHDIFILHGNISDPPLNTPKVIKIEDNVWIGARATILKGVTIGKGSVIGANSCVTSDIPSNSIAVGSPARVVKEGIEWKR
jgi:acetyltransferase-like isoleucine patch superfamily enzyme